MGRPPYLGVAGSATGKRLLKVAPGLWQSSPGLQQWVEDTYCDHSQDPLRQGGDRGLEVTGCSMERRRAHLEGGILFT